MKIGDRIYVRGYIDEIRKDTVIIRNAGGYFGTIPSEVITGDLPSVQAEQRWIPCSERLPEKAYGQYWVCTDTGFQCQCRWTDNVYGLGSSGEWAWKIFDIPQYSHVIAWMPLPEPYTERGGQDEQENNISG